MQRPIESIFGVGIPASSSWARFAAATSRCFFVPGPGTKNREPASHAPHAWPEPLRDALTDLDHEVLRSLPDNAFGAPPDGTWATTRFVDPPVLPGLVSPAR